MNRTYRVIVTRDTTESTLIDVEAKNEDDAASKAFKIVTDPTATDITWGTDDCVCSAPYVTRVSEVP